VKPNFKVIFAVIPRRLVARDAAGSYFVGWVWMQRARLTNNLHHGWVAFLDDQTKDKLRICPCCKRPIDEEVAS